MNLNLNLNRAFGGVNPIQRFNKSFICTKRSDCFKEGCPWCKTSQNAPNSYTYSILSATPATKKKRTRVLTAFELCSYARPPLPEVDHRNNHGHRLFYCSRCNYSGAALNRVEEHLRKHGIKLTARPSLKKQAIDGSLAGIFKKQDERQAKRNIEEEKILKSVVNKKAFDEALARLITVRALPHSILGWLKLYTLLYSINYMCLDSVV